MLAGFVEEGPVWGAPEHERPLGQRPDRQTTFLFYFNFFLSILAA